MFAKITFKSDSNKNTTNKSVILKSTLINFHFNI